MDSRDSILLISPPGPEGSSSFSLFSADSLVPDATPTMWAIAGLVVAIVVGSVILFLIIRDALEDNTNWLHGLGGVVIWIGLALCIEGCQVLARTLSTQDGIQWGVDGDVWIAIGWRTIFYTAIPVLTLLGFALGKTFWKNRQDRKAAERARHLRGTLPRK